MHDDAYIGGRSENNIKCVVHDDLGWKNRTTRYILPLHSLYEWFSQFHSCGTYSVLSRSPSIVEIFPEILDNSDRQLNWLLPLPVSNFDLLRRSIWADQLHGSICADQSLCSIWTDQSWVSISADHSWGWPIIEFCLCWSIAGSIYADQSRAAFMQTNHGFYLCRPITGLHLCRPVMGLHLCQPIVGLHLCRPVNGLHLCQPIVGLHLCRPIMGSICADKSWGSIYAHQSQV